MSKDLINDGDLVSVSFHGAGYTLLQVARVEYMPCATGDSWIFRDTYSGQVHYISEGCTVTLKSEGGADES